MEHNKKEFETDKSKKEFGSEIQPTKNIDSI
jgi:hypothetical protein